MATNTPKWGLFIEKADGSRTRLGEQTFSDPSKIAEAVAQQQKLCESQGSKERVVSRPLLNG